MSLRKEVIIIKTNKLSFSLPSLIDKSRSTMLVTIQEFRRRPPKTHHSIPWNSSPERERERLLYIFLKRRQTFLNVLCQRGEGGANGGESERIDEKMGKRNKKYKEDAGRKGK